MVQTIKDVLRTVFSTYTNAEILALQMKIPKEKYRIDETILAVIKEIKKERQINGTLTAN